MALTQHPRLASPEQLQETRRIHADTLAGSSGLRGSVRGLWQDDPAIEAAKLADLIRNAEQDPRAECIKRAERVLVTRAELLGHDALIKRYDLGGPLESLKYRFRTSRARRYWAAAHTLKALDIATPEALGFLEIYRGGVPARSYAITRFIEDAVDSRLWIEPELHRQPPEMKKKVFRALRDAVIDLYRRGVYHRDTKTSNLLLKKPVDTTNLEFMWIDLECVQFGVTPSRHDVIRNLVQLNGSFGPDVGENDRLSFFQEFAEIYPWISEEHVIEHIWRWTNRRLGKEQRLPCDS